MKDKDISTRGTTLSIFRKPFLASALFGLACGEPSAPRSAPDADGAAAASASATLIECPSSTTQTGGGLLGPLGGTLQVGPATVVIPAGALLGETPISITVPASKYLEIDVSVPGTEHFIFQQPIAVTVDYGRCSRADIGLKLLQVWYIDSATKQPLEAMPTVDNKLTHSVTFTTGHLSGYALAN